MSNCGVSNALRWAPLTYGRMAPRTAPGLLGNSVLGQRFTTLPFPRKSSLSGRSCRRSHPRPSAFRPRLQPIRLVNTQALIYRVQSAARTTGNLAVICVGLAILGGVPYFLFSDLLGSEGHIRWFSDALQRIRHDPDVIKYVGTPIKGYGDPGSRMARNRTINHTLTRDARGVEHLLIRFYIEGPKDTGTVKLELSKDARGAWHYNYILVEVPGHGRSSWRIVVDTSRPAPPPAWRETLADTQAFIVTEGCRAWHVTKQCSLVAYDHARDWIASFRDR